MKRWFRFVRHCRMWALACLLSQAATAIAQNVVLDYRLQAGKDLRVETVTETVNDVRLKVDRGLGEQVQARGVRFPFVIQTTERQVMRQWSGKPLADGSFQAELTMLEKSMLLRSPDGQVHDVPDTSGMVGLRMAAVIDADGRLREDSIQVSGLNGEAGETAAAVMGSVLQQVAALEPLVLREGASVPQSLRMSLPLPGQMAIELTMHTTYRLLGIDNGVADIETVHRMDFHLPDGPVRMQADGAGGGRMRFELATRTLRLNESSWVAEIELDTPEGLIAMGVSTRFTQHMRDAD